MNTNMLRGKIVEKGFTLKSFSEATGIKKSALYRKLNRQTEFDRKDIEAISNVLSLDGTQVYEIFFTPKVS